MSLSDDRVKSFGVRIGRLLGVEVWVHWLLPLVLVVQLVMLFRFSFSLWLATASALVLSVFFHELGHCLAAFRQGGGAERIVLWPLGGLAYCDAPQLPRCQFWVAAGGPLASLALALAAGGGCLAAGAPLLPSLGGEGVPGLGLLFLQYAVLWNFFILVLNLLPCHPLDGGRMLQAILWARLESKGESLLLTVRLSLVSALVAGLAGFALLILCLGTEFKLRHPFLSELSWGLLLVAVIAFYETRSLQHRLAYGEEEEGIFGYDFSRGYTSLERTTTGVVKRRSFLNAWRTKLGERARAQKQRRDKLTAAELDRLLEKIQRQGMESLERSERRFLARASKRLRNR